MCARCCVEHCRQESPGDFAACAEAGHPTWPGPSSELPRKLVCIEGFWQGGSVFDRSTVRPFLEGFAAQLDGGLRLAYRRVGSLAELERLATETLWEDPAAADVPVFYLAFHGRKGVLDLGDAEANLGVLTRIFEGYGEDHLLYFSSCSTLGGRAGPRLAKALLKSAGSRAVIGYRNDVDWLEGMMIDLLFLERFFTSEDPWTSVREIHDSVVSDVAIAKRLGFTMFEGD